MEKTIAPTNASSKVAASEPTQPMLTEGPSAIPVEVLADATVEPSKERTKIVSPTSLSTERTRSVGSEDVPQPKIGGEVATEFTLSEAILQQIVAGDSVVPLLKYLDTKRKKYTVRKMSGFYVELIGNRTKLKRAEVVKREWDSATTMTKERAASLTAECVAAKAALGERKNQLWEKEIECEVLQLNLAKESGRCAELEKTHSGICISNENA
ncbi:hypothetical protein AXG93_2354s1020 [Marchantia polymorpha subsp. ruderalis]|uniref:Uncharacterized protein n=1 Tax=Marchantia polymorpha subsp. ruderalis TaxID=1480154 RepID=A0A176WTH8_MARPO|nr:hypothetical protein AXG93_2354s1020 [Marchantia polymorpha subsp. ruderalis]